MTAAGWRSVFYFCQILKAINEFLLGDWHGPASLFHRRQRLQITIGDSNMAQFAEYLKIGTTLLVLEAIEAGELLEVPQLRHPLQALRSISTDPSLLTRLPLVGGAKATALEIQRYYLNACRRYLLRRGEADVEAQEIVRLWEETLDALEECPTRLIGKLDWVTKRHLLDGMGQYATIEEKRKLDMRYHELSREGYYLQLEAAGVAPTIVDPEEVLKAIHAPPEGTPANMRGKLIQEFEGTGHRVQASWSSVVVSTGEDKRLISLRK
jgi:proteasome accessory factor A